MHSVAHYKIILLFFSCAGLGALGAWLIAGMTFRERLLDTPNVRSSHTIPTPRGAGVGILTAFIMAGLTLRIPTTFLFCGDPHLRRKFLRGLYPGLGEIPALLSGTLYLYFPFSPTASSECPIRNIHDWIFPIPLLSDPVTDSFFHDRDAANLYNFMDGINGIAGLSGLICFGLLGVYTLFYRPVPDAFRLPDSSLTSFDMYCLSLLGLSSIHMPRARVFMGDVGSILLGFVFASLVVTLSRDYLEMICFSALIFPFYADELTTMAVRLQNHEDLTRSHRRPSVPVAGQRVRDCPLEDLRSLRGRTTVCRRRRSDRLSLRGTGSSDISNILFRSVLCF